MKTPTIVQSQYHECDLAINSAVLRAIHEEIMHVKYDRKTDTFSSEDVPWWGIYIEDEHDEAKNGIEEPHYHLEIGEGEYRMHAPAKFATRYNDLESLDDCENIEKSPGWWRIHVWVPYGNARKIAEAVDAVYRKVMKDTLSEFFILASELLDD